MPYIFSLLLLLNILMFGFYSYLHKPNESESVIQAKSQLINPVSFANVSNEIPPEIGSKK